MNNLNLNRENKYDDIPVIYCKSCLSLAIENLDAATNFENLEEGVISPYDFCGNCGSTDLEVSTIKEYQERYKQRFGYSPLKTY